MKKEKNGGSRRLGTSLYPLSCQRIKCRRKPGRRSGGGREIRQEVCGRS